MVTRLSLRRALIAGLVLVLTVPAMGTAVRWQTHFKATFDSVPDPGQGQPLDEIPAEVGFFESNAPSDAFTVEEDLPGQGHLTFTGVGSPKDLVLRAVLVPPFEGDDVYGSMQVSPGSDFKVSFIDDNDTPLIDVGFFPGGDIDVGGNEIPLEWSSGEDYLITFHFSNPTMGMARYTLTISEALDTSSTAPTVVASDTVTGPLYLAGGPVSLSAIDFVVPAGTGFGSINIDDVKVLSPIPGMTQL